MADERETFKPQTIRIKNIQRIIDIFRNENELTIHDIVTKCHLSKTAVKKIIDGMIEIGIISVAGKGSSSRNGGKRPEVFLLNNSFAYAFSCSIVETKILIGFRDFKMDLVCRKSYRSDNHTMSYQEVLDHTAALIKEILKDYPKEGGKLIGIAYSIPGIINYKDGIIVNPLHAPEWGYHLPFAADMKKLLNLDCPVYMDNSSRFSTYNLHAADDDRSTTNTVVIHYYSQFIGGSVLRGNHLVHGRYGLSGEFGHLLTDYTFSETCSCGKKGCFESFVRHRSVVNRALKTINLYPQSLLYGKPLTFESISNAADEGDSFARTQMDYLVRQFSHLLYLLQLTLDPTEFYLHCINNGAEMLYFREQLQNSLDRETLSMDTVPLHISVHINETQDQIYDHSSTLKGGIRFCFDQYFSNEAYIRKMLNR